VLGASGEGLERQELEVEELAILAAAARTGEIYLLTTQQTGPLVRAGTETFIDEADRAVTSAYVDALNSLELLGLVRFEAGQLYRLTRKGFKLARALTGNSDDRRA
jgi:hypothetical protein